MQFPLQFCLGMVMPVFSFRQIMIVLMAVGNHMLMRASVVCMCDCMSMHMGVLMYKRINNYQGGSARHHKQCCKIDH